jgi:putative ABC transport system permease protein
VSPHVLLRLGLRGLMVHKLRSTLSILGVFFGVAAVVATSSVGEGARREALEQIGALGIDSIRIRARPAPEGAAAPPAPLRERDVASLAAVVPHLVSLAPVREMPLVAERSPWRSDTVAVGTTPSYQHAGQLPLASGRFLTDLDISEHKRSVVLGDWVARRLFPTEEPCGQWIRLANDWFEVVGVLEPRASARSKAGPIRARDINQSVFLPLPSLDRGPDSAADAIDEIVMRVDSGANVVAAAEVAQTVITRLAGHQGFDVIVPREILRQKQRTQRIFNVVTGAIAAISLLVGGIGIMNIMLASVAERTQEVGIRRALGATRQEVAAQFLVEASLLTLAGGLSGAALGMVGSFLIQVLAGWPTALSPLMLLLAVVMALLVGIGFGLYPAWHAAGLEPMEALRHEW